MVESSPSEGPEVIQHRLAVDGFVFFRDVISAQVRERLVTAATRAAIGAALLDEDGRLRAGELKTAATAAAAAFRGMRDFRQARHEPSLRALARVVGAGRHHPSEHAAYARFVPPQTPGSHMPPHQDRHFLPRPEFVTIWIPLLMPRHGGGIAMAHGTHRAGAVEHAEAQVVRPPKTWRSAEYRAGDAMVFSAYTIHRSLTNRSRALRVSVDYRYVLEPSRDRGA